MGASSDIVFRILYFRLKGEPFQYVVAMPWLQWLGALGLAVAIAWWSLALGGCGTQRAVVSGLDVGAHTRWRALRLVPQLGLQSCMGHQAGRFCRSLGHDGRLR